jgi:hypothetical protein
MQCGHIIDDLGVHLLHCLCKNEHIANHDTFWDTITAIASKNGVHVQKKVFTFSLATHEDDIVITKNSFGTLANVVIVDLTCINLV